MNGTKILSGFNVLSTNPIDSRYITDNLSAVANPYIGLRVYNKEDNKIYVYRKQIMFIHGNMNMVMLTILMIELLTLSTLLILHGMIQHQFHQLILQLKNIQIAMLF